MRLIELGQEKLDEDSSFDRISNKLRKVAILVKNKLSDDTTDFLIKHHEESLIHVDRNPIEGEKGVKNESETPVQILELNPIDQHLTSGGNEPQNGLTRNDANNNVTRTSINEDYNTLANFPNQSFDRTAPPNLYGQPKRAQRKTSYNKKGT